MTDKARIRALERELRRTARTLARLAHLFLTHVRTDLAPDAALPAARRLVREIERTR